MIEDEVGAPRLATGVQLAAHDDAAFGKADFLANLLLDVPAGQGNSRGDEFSADVSFSERLLVHYPKSLSSLHGATKRAPLMFDGLKYTLLGVSAD